PRTKPGRAGVRGATHPRSRGLSRRVGVRAAGRRVTRLSRSRRRRAVRDGRGNVFTRNNDMCAHGWTWRRALLKCNDNRSDRAQKSTVAARVRFGIWARTRSVDDPARCATSRWHDQLYEKDAPHQRAPFAGREVGFRREDGYGGGSPRARGPDFAVAPMSVSARFAGRNPTLATFRGAVSVRRPKSVPPHERPRRYVRLDSIPLESGALCRRTRRAPEPRRSKRARVCV